MSTLIYQNCMICTTGKHALVDWNIQAELDVSMGYDKNNKGEVVTDNKRNGYSPKTVNSEFGEIQLDIPRDRKGELSPKSFLSIVEISQALKKKLSHFMHAV